MDIGVDKVLFTTKAFSVKDRCNFRIKQGDIVDGEVVESNLFRDELGDVLGTKAIYNSKIANTTISPIGLKVEYNPSKLLHPYHLNNDNNSLSKIHQIVKKDLKENAGIELGLDAELSLSRLDIARNEQLSKPISAYGPLFSSLKGKRQSNVEYPSSYYFKNKSQESVFYDKVEALKYEYKNVDVPDIVSNTMRAELKAKKRSSVGSIFRFNDMDTFLNCNPDYRVDKYKSQLRKQLFQGDKSHLQTTLFTDYDRDIEYLKALKEANSRGAINKFIQSKGLDSLLSEVGSIENFRQMLLEAGYSDKYSFRKVAEIKRQLHEVSMFFGDSSKQNITSLYNEIYAKFVA